MPNPAVTSLGYKSKHLGGNVARELAPSFRLVPHIPCIQMLLLGHTNSTFGQLPPEMTEEKGNALGSNRLTVALSSSGEKNRENLGLSKTCKKATVRHELV